MRRPVRPPYAQLEELCWCCWLCRRDRPTSNPYGLMSRSNDRNRVSEWRRSSYVDPDGDGTLAVVQ
jgi:hypothetical protein